MQEAIESAVKQETKLIAALSDYIATGSGKRIDTSGLFNEATADFLKDKMSQMVARKHINTHALLDSLFVIGQSSYADLDRSSPGLRMIASALLAGSGIIIGIQLLTKITLVSRM